MHVGLVTGALLEAPAPCQGERKSEMEGSSGSSVFVSRRRLAAFAVIVALVAMPIGAVASHVFTDVPDDHLFHGDIAAIADAGVTRGCNPPANTEYCPSDNVTRGQMAAFMNRLGALSGGSPVVNAATALEAETAKDAGTLGGFAPDELVRVASAAAAPQFFDEEPFALPAFMGIGTLLETTIEAPNDGFLIVNAHSEVSNLTETDIAVCGIVLDQELVIESSVGFTQHDQSVTDAEGRPLINVASPPGEEPFDVGAVNMEEDCISSTVFPVQAGTYGVSFEALFALDSTEWWNHAMSVLYVPFDGQGNPPATFEITSVDRDDLDTFRTQLLARYSR